jgi:hypothetical protein
MNTIDLKFKNINTSGVKQPRILVEINGTKLTEEEVNTEVSLNFKAQQTNVLKIHFVNKQGRDTVTNTMGEIVSDMNFELDTITIDGIDIKDLKWQGNYHTDNDSIESCLFFGPKGYYELIFSSPVLKWTLEQNHLKNQDDPEWEEDYNYYTEAWNKLNSK